MASGCAVVLDSGTSFCFADNSNINSSMLLRLCWWRGVLNSHLLPCSALPSCSLLLLLLLLLLLSLLSLLLLLLLLLLLPPPPPLPLLLHAAAYCCCVCPAAGPAFLPTMHTWCMIIWGPAPSTNTRAELRQWRGGCSKRFNLG
jgi:hypothetical protein